MGEAEAKKLDPDKAENTRVLIREDIKKYELAKKQALIQVAQYDAMIAECELALADISRQERGVDYPKPPAKPAKPTAGPGTVIPPGGIAGASDDSGDSQE